MDSPPLPGPLPGLIDSHCHLDYLERDGQDIAEVLERARLAGVAGALTIGTSLKHFPRVLDLASKHPELWCSVGVHPHESAEALEQGTVQELEATLRRFLDLSRPDSKIVGIGETGLDYFYDHSPHDLQIQAFEIHIELARETQLPIIIHMRDAEDDMIRVLDRHLKQGHFPALIHCFSASIEFAAAMLERGLYLSFSGIVTFKKAKNVQEAAVLVPVDRYLIETDSPYLAPVPFRGRKNEPAFVRHVAEQVANLRGVGLEQVACESRENFFRLFSSATSRQNELA